MQQIQPPPDGTPLELTRGASAKHIKMYVAPAALTSPLLVLNLKPFDKMSILYFFC